MIQTFGHYEKRVFTFDYASVFEKIQFFKSFFEISHNFYNSLMVKTNSSLSEVLFI